MPSHVKLLINFDETDALFDSSKDNSQTINISSNVNIELLDIINHLRSIALGDHIVPSSYSLEL